MARVTSNHPAWNRQCCRIKKDGTQCRLPAIRGGTCCHKHGAAKPEVKARAKERIQEIREYMYDCVPQAVKNLVELQDEAYPPMVRLNAAKALLDKALPKQLEVELDAEAAQQEADLDEEIAAALGAG